VLDFHLTLDPNLNTVVFTGPPPPPINPPPAGGGRVGFNASWITAGAQPVLVAVPANVTYALLVQAIPANPPGSFAGQIFYRGMNNHK
jgi:hypothetical protein